jgi:branched-chain amino acid transport system permease protein
MSRLNMKAGSPRYKLCVGLATVIALVILLAIPNFVSNATQVDAVSQILAYAVAIVGLVLLTGYTGQISIGHSAFVGLGAYTTVILVQNHGWPYLATIPVAAVFCLIAGGFVGIPALRISGLYLVAVTLAVAAVFPTLVDQFTSLTGGPNGMIASREMAPPRWFPYSSAVAGPNIFHYYVIFALAAMMFLIARGLVRSRIGRALVAIRDSPYSAAAAGIPVARYKVATFAVSAAFAGVAGSMLMIILPSVSDTEFSLTFAISLIIGLIAGGRASIWGAIPGAIVVALLNRYIPDLFNSLNVGGNNTSGDQLVGVVSGAGLIAFAFLLPNGIAEAAKRGFTRTVRVAHTPPEGWEHYATRPPVVNEPLAAGEGLTSAAPDLAPTVERKESTI